jgi:rare lipoprotein A
MDFGKSMAMALLFASASLTTTRGALAETGTHGAVEATWYGGRHCGRETASGERYDCRGMTAAHPWLPFGTRIRVRNLRNNRVAMLRVNDRGPAAWTGNGLDVSPAGRDALGLGGKARVSVTVVSSPMKACACYPAPGRRRYKKHRR